MVDNRHIYTYSNKSWVPFPTRADGDCFFHALFGKKEEMEGFHFYFDKLAEFRRFYWCAFLMYFLNGDMPDVLLQTIQSCFLANDRFMGLDPRETPAFEDYIKNVALRQYWVSVEEIPIISTLWNVKVVLFLGDQEVPRIFEPVPQLLGDFPFGNLLPLREKVIRLANNHFERLNVVLQPDTGITVESSRPELEYCEDFNFDDEVENTVYAQRKNYSKGGSAGVQGSFYQIRVLAMVLLNALKKSRVWLLSTENEQAGKFDDLVFESPGGDTLLQAKHKEGKKKVIAYEALFSTTSSDFSLPKYFLSFQEIRSRFNIRNVIICSNAGLQTNKKMKGLIEKHTVTEESVLHFEGAENTFYTFKENALKDLKESIKTYHKQNIPNIKTQIADEDIKEFLAHFQFFPHFMEKVKMEDIVHNLLSSIDLASELKCKDTFEAVRKVVEEWFQDGSGRYFSNVEAKAVLCDVRSTKFCDVLQSYNISFKKELAPLQKDSDNSKKVIHIVPIQEATLHMVRIHQKFQKDQVKVLYLNPEDALAIQKDVIETFSVPRYNFLVIPGVLRVSENVTKKVCEKLKKILDKFDYKKLVLVSQSENNLAQQIRFSFPQRYEEIKEDIWFEDLTDEAQEMLRNKRNITFQGTHMTLAELIGPRLELADSYVIAELARNGRVEIGLTPRHSDESIDHYYIYRTLKRDNEGIQEQQFGHLENFNDRIVLISDTAGMGKTTILTNLAIHIKMNHPSKWVIGINLNNHSSTFKAASKKRSRSLGIADILNAHDVTNLKTEFMKRLFFKNDNVVLMLDAVDEVSSSYLKLVMTMIEEVTAQRNFVKIFVTTRPHLCQELQERLRVTAFTLEQFSKENQVDFLTRYWIQKLQLRTEREMQRCQQYAVALINEMSRWINENAEETFAGIPLQTRMLAEVFQERNPLNEGEVRDWEECKQFLLSNKEQPKLPNKINLIQLYDLFIATKRDIFVDIKGNTGGNAITEDALLKKFEECHQFHRNLALPIFFYTQDCQLFRCFKRWEEFSDSFVENYVLRAGIVQRVDGKINFIHRTFAEYFIAQCLILELKRGSLSEDFRKLLLEEILVREEFYVIRAFFDSFVQKELANIADSTLREFSGLNYLSLLSYSRNSYFHLFAQEGSVGLLKFFITCINYGIDGQRELEEEEGVIVDSIDMDCNTPLHEACYWGHINVVVFLIERGANVNRTNANWSTPLHLAACKGHFEVVQYLVEEARADMNLINSYGESVLVSAAQGGSLEVVKYLIEHRINYAPIYTTPLHIASSEGFLDIVEYLVETIGADVNILDVNKRTPLHAACHEGQLHVVQFLVGHGSDVNALNGDGSTAFHDAGLRGCFEVVKFLVDNGADVTIIDQRGETIADIIQWFKDNNYSFEDGSTEESVKDKKEDESKNDKDEENTEEKAKGQNYAHPEEKKEVNHEKSEKCNKEDKNNE